MKYILFVFITFSSLLGKDIQYVPVSKKSIGWKNIITQNDYNVLKVSNKYKCKKYISLEELNNGEYRAKHYIIKNKPICKDDVYIAQKNKVKFNFGFLEIEKEAEVIRETDNYIKIKNANGKIEKIYKDGRER